MTARPVFRSLSDSAVDAVRKEHDAAKEDLRAAIARVDKAAGPPALHRWEVRPLSRARARALAEAVDEQAKVQDKLRDIGARKAAADRAQDDAAKPAKREAAIAAGEAYLDEYGFWRPIAKEDEK